MKIPVLCQFLDQLSKKLVNFITGFSEIQKTSLVVVTRICTCLAWNPFRQNSLAENCVDRIEKCLKDSGTHLENHYSICIVSQNLLRTFVFPLSLIISLSESHADVCWYHETLCFCSKTKTGSCLNQFFNWHRPEK